MRVAEVIANFGTLFLVQFDHAALWRLYHGFCKVLLHVLRDVLPSMETHTR